VVQPPSLHRSPAFTLEPTESYAKAELDEYIAVLREISDEAYLMPEMVKTAPHNSVTTGPARQSRSPGQVAITWRAYVKKCERDCGKGSFSLRKLGFIVNPSRAWVKAGYRWRVALSVTSLE